MNVNDMYAVNEHIYDILCPVYPVSYLVVINVLGTYSVTMKKK